MGQYSSYYLYQKFEHREGNKDYWIPVYPNTFSVDADGTQPKVIKLENDTECGYVPPIEPIYRWYKEGFICDKCPDIYRWNQGDIDDYICDRKSKFYKEYYQVSHDEGETWENVVGVNPRQGGLIEAYSSDCGFDNSAYKNQYFTLKATSECTFSFQLAKYSLDSGSTWQSGYTVTVSSGQKVMLKMHQTMAYSWGGAGTISSTGTFEVEGNINSLQLEDEFLSGDDVAYPNAFMELFKGCTGLTSAEHLVLPANTLTLRCYKGMFSGCTNLTAAPALTAINLADRCYESMFEGCTSLTVTPILPATTLAYSCYHNMFKGCTSLTVPTVLPAITLSNYCYESMFEGCTSLVKAPRLYAPSLVNYCYSYMFYGCSSLNYIECFAVDGLSSSHCLDYWLYNVSSTGTFIKSIWTEFPSGASGIPSGWEVE